MKRFLVHFDTIHDTIVCKTEKEARELADSCLVGASQIYEEYQQKDLFNNLKTVKVLIKEFTPGLPNNGVFRIINSHDIRQCKKRYCLQKYNPQAHAWQNYKLSDDIENLKSYMGEVK